LAFRHPGGADRPAVDAGGLHPGEQPPVEAGVPGADGAVAGVVVHIHAGSIMRLPPNVRRFSDSKGPDWRISDSWIGMRPQGRPSRFSAEIRNRNPFWLVFTLF